MVGPERYNSTDGVIIRGIEYLLSLAYKDCKIHYIKLWDIKPQAPWQFDVLDIEMDLIIVCGTPWLWDSFQNSVKYKNLNNCFLNHPRAKRLFMGIGTCLSLRRHKSILKRPEEVAGIRMLFNDSTVIVREPIAKHMLDNAGIESTFLPCPAYYAYGDESQYPTHKSNVMVYIDPTKSISACDFQNESKLGAFNDIFIKFNKKYGPIVCIANEADRGMAEAIGLKDILLLSEVGHTLDVAKGVNKMLSGRVHCAVPAIAQGADVILVPLDTRSMVVKSMVGVDPYNHINDYIRILRSI